MKQNSLVAFGPVKFDLFVFGLLAVLWLALGLSPRAAWAETVWVEGESPTEASVKLDERYDAVMKSLLSEGDWLSHFDRFNPGSASYEVTVEDGGPYQLWWRGNVEDSITTYSVNGSEPKIISIARVMGRFDLAQRRGIQRLGWVNVGEVSLKPGVNTFTFSMESPAGHHGGIDCFFVSNDGFEPLGTTQPGGEPEPGPADWFTPDVFKTSANQVKTEADKAVFDLSKQLPKPAGQFGVLQADGRHLRFEQAEQPVRFLGVNLVFDPTQETRETLSQRVRYLAKYGVNAVRFPNLFATLGPLKPGDQPLDADRLAKFDWLCHELKEAGIYWHFTFFDPMGITQEHADYLGIHASLFAELPAYPDPYWAVQGYRSLQGLGHYIPGVLKMQKEYVLAVLHHINPHTNMSYADDPALTMVEWIGDDSVFAEYPLTPMWRKKLPQHQRYVEQRFYQWAVSQYGSAAGIREAWGDLREADQINGDGPGRLQLMAAFHMAPNGPIYKFKEEVPRVQDFIRFLHDLQATAQAEQQQVVRDLGFRGLFIGNSASVTAGSATHLARLAIDAQADAIARRVHIGGIREAALDLSTNTLVEDESVSAEMSVDNGNGITPGTIADVSHIYHTGGGLLGLARWQLDDKPFIVSSWSMQIPTDGRFEAMPIITGYGLGLQGWDAIYHEANRLPHLAPGWHHTQSSDTLDVLGLYPAMAIANQNQHFPEGRLVALQRVSEADLFTATDQFGYDPAIYGWLTSAQGRAEDPRFATEYAAAGRVATSFMPGRDYAGNLVIQNSPYSLSVWADHRQLLWDAGRQMIFLLSDYTQGVVGRPGVQPFRLPAVEYLHVRTGYVTLVFTPLDNLPLAESRSILLTALSRNRQTNASLGGATYLREAGEPPLLMLPVQATIRLVGDRPRQVDILNAAGEPTGRIVRIQQDRSFVIDGRQPGFYYHIRR